MGREIRMVPPNWEHPRYTREDAPYNPMRSLVGEYKPVHDELYSVAARRWVDEMVAFYARPVEDRRKRDDGSLYEYWEWEGGPPDRDYYLPDGLPDRTWFQAYQTVSEGSPVSPPFATQDELIDYLTTHGDFWDQKRGDAPPSRAAAERFVRGGSVPSMVMQGGQVFVGIGCADAFPATDETAV